MAGPGTRHLRPADEALLQACPSLKVIVFLGTGAASYIDLAAAERLLPFETLREVVGFDDYDRLLSIVRESAGRTEEAGPADYREDLLTRGERIPLTPDAPTVGYTPPVTAATTICTNPAPTTQVR